jgi:FlaA1/EpsC-like NDP-sugar epimerase
MIRFFTSTDYLSLITILLLVHVVSYLIGYFLPGRYHLQAEIFLISFFVTSIYIVVSRFCISFLYLHYRKSKKVVGSRGLLIYGTGNLGVFLKKNIIETYSNEYRLVGFLDNNPYNIGRSIGGYKVYDANGDLRQLITQHAVSDIIIAKSDMTPAEKSALLEKMLELNLRVREMMPVKNMFSKFNMDKLAVLDINDLMNREAIELYGEHVADYLKGKSAMVTGAAGSIGSEIVRKLAEHKVSPIICIDFSESALYDLQQELLRKHSQIDFKFILADIRNEEAMDLVFRKHQPDVVYHAAAYKHVPLMEQFPWQAIDTNVMGTWMIAKKAVEFKAEKFVFISSDKAVNPTSVMGATKRLAEILVQSLSSQRTATSFVVTRFGNVLGSNGSVVPLFKKQIQEGGPLTVTHPDMTRYFMTIAEACQLVLEASVMAKGGEIFVFDMGKPVKILDLATNMIRLAGFVPGSDIKISFTGLRPGEKLYEDLFSEKEKMKETYHDKIMISHESSHEVQSAEMLISRLSSLENIYEPQLFRKVIQELLPEYRPESLEEQVMKIKAGALTSNPIGISNIASVN